MDMLIHYSAIEATSAYPLGSTETTNAFDF